jgi:hypothetical protein
MRDGNFVGNCAFAGLPAARIPAARRANPHLLIFPAASRENGRVVMLMGIRMRGAILNQERYLYYSQQLKRLVSDQKNRRVSPY